MTTIEDQGQVRPDAPSAAYAELDRETAALFARRAALHRDDPEAQRVRDRIIELQLPLAEHLARRFGAHGHLAEDLLQVARLGLVQAVDRFDPGHGIPFFGFATPTITGELKRYVRDRSWSVRVPRHLQELHLALTRAGTELAGALRRSPTIADLAAHLGVSEETVIEGLEAAHAFQALSLSTPVGPDADGTSLADVLGGPDPAITAVDNHDALHRALATLPERERRIMAMRFFGNLNQTDIATELGISQMHVSRLIRQSLAALRAQMSDA